MFNVKEYNKKYYQEHKEQHNANGRKHAAKRYIVFRKDLDEIKLSRGCIDCGYNLNPAALQFDHIVPSEKSFKIATSYTRNWQAVLKEIEKCETRCANCHAIKSKNNNDNGAKKNLDNGSIMC